MKKRKRSSKIFDVPEEVFHFKIFKFIGDVPTIVNSIKLSCKWFSLIVNNLLNNELFLKGKDITNVHLINLKRLKINKLKYFKNEFYTIENYEKEINTIHVKYVLDEINEIIKNSKIIIFNRPLITKIHSPEIISINLKIDQQGVKLKLLLDFNEFFSCYVFFQSYENNKLDLELDNSLFPKSQVFFYKRFKELYVHDELFTTFFIS